MDFNAWLAVAGGGFLLIAALGARIAASPFTPVMVFVMIGAALGPWGGEWITLDVEEHSPVLLRITEIIVLVSLFAAGLKLDLPLRDARWKAAGFLALVSMPLTVGLIAGVMVTVFGWSWGAAILLGGILAPTDPVLATDVQVAGPRDRDRLRFTLTGEAGMNDATAFPFVYLGLGLLGLRDLGEWGWRWLAFDVVTGMAGGAVIGALTGYVAARWIRRPGKTEHAYDECFLLGVIAVSYAGAMLVHTAGFISVFAAGVAMRATEKRHVARQKNSGAAQEKKRVRAVLAFNEELERILTVGVAALIGVLLASVRWTWEAAGLAAGLFFVLRPLAVAPLALWIPGFADARSLARIGWFGVRGVGSLFYLMYAVEAGVSGQTGRSVIDITLITVALSIFVHGITASWGSRPGASGNSARSDGDAD
jgi:NhaP-type Na+/H+ or K+/H+ antiporter